MTPSLARRAFPALALAASLAACDNQITSPDPNLVLAPESEVEIYFASVADARIRITPGLSDAATGASIETELSRLDRHLRNREVGRVHSALQSLRNLIGQYAPASRVRDGAELSAIELVVDAVQRLLSEPT